MNFVEAISSSSATMPISQVEQFVRSIGTGIFS